MNLGTAHARERGAGHTLSAMHRAQTRRPPALGRVRRRLRQACAGYSLADLGRMTGDHPENIRRYLSGIGKTPFSFEYATGLCHATGLSADWLLLGRGLPWARSAARRRTARRRPAKAAR